jgi:CPA1 family monovalent cation:H+ antiporter
MLSTEILIILLLFIISLVSLFMRRIRLPYTVALVLVGLGLSFFARDTVFQSGSGIDLSDNLILYLFLPPLVFQAAFELNYESVKRNLIPILLLAVPGVLIVTFVTAGILVISAGVAVSTALVFGAIISATDPVAVVSIFKELGAPQKLSTIIEGESLFNDGTAIVIYTIITGVIVTGQFSLVESIFQFFLVSLGGLAVGIILGWAYGQLIAAIDDPLVETMLTVVLAYGSFIMAEAFFDFSGVLAVVAAGIFSSQVGPSRLSATTKVVLFNFWDFLAFLINSLIFLLIGLDTNFSTLIDHSGLIVLAWVAVLVSRVISVYGLSWVSSFFKNGKLPMSWQHVMAWSGLRGAVGLALALGLSSDQFSSESASVQTMTFGVVLMTLLIQGTTMKPLVKKLDIVTHSPTEIEYDKLLGRSTALKASKNRLNQLHEQGLVPPKVWETLYPQFAQQETEAAEKMQTLIEQDPSVQEDVVKATLYDLLIMQRGTLRTLHLDGIIGDEVFRELVTDVDVQLAEIEETH